MRCDRSRLVVLAVIWVLTGSSLPVAQVPVTECGPNDVVPWWPRGNFTDGAQTLTAAERSTVEARLGEIEALVRKSPYAAARGFAVQPNFGFHEITDRTQLYSYEFVLDTKHLCSKYDEYSAHMIVTVNPGPMSWSAGDRPWIDERGEAFYMERPRREPLLGSTATFGAFHEENTNTSAFFLLFTGSASPTLPVSREEYLRYRIYEHEGKDQAKVKELAATAAKTPYQRWVDDTAGRKKRNEELLAIIATAAPAQVEKTRADFERIEKTEAERLKRDDASDRERQAKDLAIYKAIGDGYRAQITAMSAPERSAQAFLLGDDLVAQGTRDAYGIVRKNPAFYRARTSPFEPRAILVSMPVGHKDERPQQAQLYKQFDWAALKRLVAP